jgi:hypothetical protein
MHLFVIGCSRRTLWSCLEFEKNAPPVCWGGGLAYTVLLYPEGFRPLDEFGVRGQGDGMTGASLPRLSIEIEK